jgi:hypothetical protein
LNTEYAKTNTNTFGFAIDLNLAPFLAPFFTFTHRTTFTSELC